MVRGATRPNQNKKGGRRFNVRPRTAWFGRRLARTKKKGGRPLNVRPGTAWFGRRLARTKKKSGESSECQAGLG